MAQVCAYELGIPISMVTVRGTNTVVEPNNMNTGGSVTSESCCQVLIQHILQNTQSACQITTVNYTELNKGSF